MGEKNILGEGKDKPLPNGCLENCIPSQLDVMFTSHRNNNIHCRKSYFYVYILNYPYTYKIPFSPLRSVCVFLNLGFSSRGLGLSVQYFSCSQHCPLPDRELWFSWNLLEPFSKLRSHSPECSYHHWKDVGLCFHIFSSSPFRSWYFSSVLYST